MRGTIFQFLYPPRCAVCDELLEPERIAAGVHEGCMHRLVFVGRDYCMHCGKPLERETQEYCHDCGRVSFSSFSQGRSVFEYRGDARHLMYRFKYANRREYAAFLARAACARWGGWIEKRGVQAVVPVPMYRKKERLRGYNQAALFARELALRTGLDYVPDAVCRMRDTCPQKELNDVERKNNLKNAFHTAQFIVQYRKVLLVDDIYTTGSTVEAIADGLCGAGVEQVDVLTACIGRGL